jgi:hypothetical protein
MQNAIVMLNKLGKFLLLTVEIEVSGQVFIDPTRNLPSSFSKPLAQLKIEKQQSTKDECKSIFMMFNDLINLTTFAAKLVKNTQRQHATDSQLGLASSMLQQSHLRV